MTTWAEIQVGELVEHEGEPHEVKVIKRGGTSARVVIEPIGEEGQLVAKKSIRVRLGEQAPQPEGADETRADEASSLIEEVLGGVPVATVVDDAIICPPMGTTTIAAHLKIIHGVELRGLPISGEDEMLRIHKELHEAPFHEPAHKHIHQEVEQERRV